MVFLALVPVLAVMVVSVARRPAHEAALWGLALALLVSALWFPAPLQRWSGLAAEWGPTVVEVLLIILGGLLLSGATQRSGRQQRLARWLGRSVGTGPAAALAVIHGVTPFAESVTGFGIGVTLGVPLLVHLGFSSRRAAFLGLLGLCAVPWGSMGPGTLIASGLSGTGLQPLGVSSAVASGPVFLAVGLVAAWTTSTAAGRARAVVGALLSGTMLWVGVLGANLLLGTAPAGAVGALLTLAAHLLYHRLRGSRVGMDRKTRYALIGYAVLLGGVLASTAVLRIAGLFSGPWHYLASPALWLFVAVGLTTPGTIRRRVATSAWRSWTSVGPVTGLFIVLGVVMAGSGMSEALARGAASGGAVYLMILPLVAGLGGYLTGSNSAANAMFAAPQGQIAAALGVPALAAVGVHNVGASLLTMASPGRVALASQLCPEPKEARKSVRGLLAVDALILVVLGLFLGGWKLLV